ncbi:MAG: phosphoribosyltransferase family protein [Patescibacteria group bacterium]|nr:phosphoribosyltransferase family protein [Patescibacteria group bacterium]
MIELTKPYVPLSEAEIDKIFALKKAIFKGHFVYSNGGHGDIYVDKSVITLWPIPTSILCRDIAWQWCNANIEAVLGLAMGVIKLTDRVSEWLTIFTGKKIPALYTEKDDTGKQVLKRGINEMNGKRTLIIEDIVNTGGSIKNTIEVCVNAGAIVVGCHSLVDRSSGTVTAETLGVEEFISLKTMTVANYVGNCLLCEA